MRCEPGIKADDRSADTVPNCVRLRAGMIGFENLKEMEIVFAEEELPFMWLRDRGQSGLEFLVVDPAGLVPDYVAEIGEVDAAMLDLRDPAEALILNVVTVHSEGPAKVLANLVGPIVVNRRTREGRQVVLANHQLYSSRYVLVGEGALAPASGREVASC